MKITWLGQAGLLFETDGKKILIDPYLSDNVKTVNPANWRRVPVDESLFDIVPDMLICTHNHLDHLDPATLVHYLTPDAHGLFFASMGGWKEARTAFGGKTNYVMFNEGTTWTEGNVTITAVAAEHSDPDAIGVILEAEGKRYYITGDTLYNERVFASLPEGPIDAVFLPINGVGNNMNAYDAARFAERVGAKAAVPLHFGMFDELDPHIFECPNRVIPEIYQEIKV